VLNLKNNMMEILTIFLSFIIIETILIKLFIVLLGHFLKKNKLILKYDDLKGLVVYTEKILKENRNV